MAKSAKRIKKNGEVFTPDSLVQDILGKIEPAKFEDPAVTFLDPACGNGNFLVAIVTKKRAAGATPLQALSTTYGVDIMPDNIVECRQRVFKAAIHKDDLDYYRERNPFKRFVKKRTLRRMQQLVRQNICHGDALQFELEDIFSSHPSEELVSFRNQNRAFSGLDTPVEPCYTGKTVEGEQGPLAQQAEQKTFNL